MKQYSHSSGRKSRIPKRVWLLVFILLLLSVGGVITSRIVYDRGLKAVDSSQQTQLFTVEKGSTVKEIAVNLEKAKLIRSAWAFQLYIHSKDLNSGLQAGTYALSSSQDVPRIVDIMTQGKVTTKLVTILPGRRIDQVRADLINAGFQPNAVDEALDPSQYADLPVLSYKPAGVTTLEGLLWPDSYQKQPDTDPSVIIRESLIAMGERLTPEVQAAFAAQGFTTYQGIIMSSIILQEVGKADEQTQVSQVFLTRLKQGMKLESDATARYGAIMADQSATNLKYDSPYSTYLYPGLPPGPISTINASSLQAAIRPAATNWLYFVSGDNGTTYFSTTLKEHEELTQKYCHKLCGN